MPEFLERKLKKQYGEKSNVPYKIMNKMGVMKGSKTTAKGKRMEAKHKRKMDRDSVMEKVMDSMTEDRRNKK